VGESAKQLVTIYFLFEVVGEEWRVNRQQNRRDRAHIVEVNYC
jgi:hypothetical protein